MKEKEKEQAWVGEGQRGRHRTWSRLQALSYQHRAWWGAQTHEPWDHDLSQSRILKVLQLYMLFNNNIGMIGTILKIENGVSNPAKLEYFGHFPMSKYPPTMIHQCLTFHHQDIILHFRKTFLEGIYSLWDNIWSIQYLAVLWFIILLFPMRRGINEALGWGGT